MTRLEIVAEARAIAAQKREDMVPKWAVVFSNLAAVAFTLCGMGVGSTQVSPDNLLSYQSEAAALSNSCQTVVARYAHNRYTVMTANPELVASNPACPASERSKVFDLMSGVQTDTKQQLIDIVEGGAVLWFCLGAPIGTYIAYSKIESQDMQEQNDERLGNFNIPYYMLEEEAQMPDTISVHA